MIDVVIIAVMSTIFIASHCEKLSFWIVPGYLLLECFLNYRMAILILIEHSHYKNQRSTVEIKSLGTEWSASGHFGSIIGKMYPKDMNVSRCKIRCIKDQKKFNLRCMMTARKKDEFSSLFE